MPDAASNDYSMLRDAVVFLLAAIVVVPLFRHFRVNSIVGYIVAGIVIGPHGLALIRDVEGTHRLAEFGIVFMLFTIGLELSFERLKTMARYVFGLGLAQVVVTGAVLASGALVFGAGWGQAAVIGGALALSSTAFVLQLLSERGELSSHFGRVVLSVLLLQDLAVVPGLAVVTALGSEPEALAWALIVAGLKAIAALGLLLAVGRLVLRPLYRMIAETRSPELFAAATLLVVLATAWGTAAAGLSMALGAFLAGLMLAGTEYRHQIEADIRPARGLLLGLFFMSIGMLLDLATIIPQLPAIIAAVALLISSKALIAAALGWCFRLPLPVAVNAGLHLAQGGEFAFVLFSLAMGAAVLPMEMGQFLLAVVAISMTLTPLLALAGRKVQARLEQRAAGGLEALMTETEGYSDHVVIAGFGRVGRTVAQMLDARDVQWIAIDLDAKNIAQARSRGLQVFFGDAAQDAITAAAGLDRARAAVITLDNPAAAASALRNIKKKLPDIPVIVRARDASNMGELMRGGATSVMPETIESSLLLGGAVLRSLGQAESEIDEVIEFFRRDAVEGGQRAADDEQ
jgi:CPA2 family monovalent cation:H+ antiporter-2